MNLNQKWRKFVRWRWLHLHFCVSLLLMMKHAHAQKLSRLRHLIVHVPQSHLEHVQPSREIEHHKKLCSKFYSWSFQLKCMEPLAFSVHVAFLELIARLVICHMPHLPLTMAFKISKHNIWGEYKHFDVILEQHIRIRRVDGEKIRTNQELVVKYRGGLVIWKHKGLYIWLQQLGHALDVITQLPLCQ